MVNVSLTILLCVQERKKVLPMQKLALQRFNFCLSGQSLRTLFVSRYEQRKEFEFNWRAQNVHGQYMAFDHSMKVLKAQRAPGGGALLNIRATLMDNTTGAILGSWSVASTSMDDAGLELAFRDFCRLWLDGRATLKVVYIDNPYRDLLGIKRRLEVPDRQKASHHFEFKGETKLVSCPAAAAAAELKAGLVWLRPADGKAVLGFDLEWPVTYSKGSQQRVALMQLCHLPSQKCLLIRLHETRRLPDELVDALTKSTLVGLNIGADIKKLLTDFPGQLKADQMNIVDVGREANSRFLIGTKKWSLAALCAEVLKQQLNKGLVEDHKGWAERALGANQIRYAANDAAAGVAILEALSKTVVRVPQREVRMVCQKGHHLNKFTTSDSNFKCDGCGLRSGPGATMHGCRECNFDMCASCQCGGEVDIKEGLEGKGTELEPDSVLVCRNPEAVRQANRVMGGVERLQDEMDVEGFTIADIDVSQQVESEDLTFEQVKDALLVYARSSVTTQLHLPKALTTDERKMAHQLCEFLSLHHSSEGDGEERHLVVSKSRESKDVEFDIEFDPAWAQCSTKYDCKHFLGNMYTMGRTASKFYFPFCSCLADATMVPLPGEAERLEGHFARLNVHANKQTRLPRKVKRGKIRHTILEPQRLYQRLKQVVIFFSMLREPDTGPHARESTGKKSVSEGGREGGMEGGR